MDPAIRSAEIIADLAPTQAEHQYNLAFLYNVKGEYISLEKQARDVISRDYKKAQEQLEKTVDLKPDYQEAWQLLLEVDRNLDDEESLEKHEERYKQLFP